MTGLSFGFTDEQEQFRQAVARFARERVAPGYRDRSNSSTYPMDLHRELAALGVLGIGLPEKFGGTGDEDPVTLGIACEELGAADVNLAAAPVAVGLTGAQLARGGTQAIQERWLPGLIDGTEFVAIGLTEPEAGSDAAALRTTATPVPGGWRISGQKNSVSHLHIAGATLVYARQPGTTGSAGVSAFLVESGPDGVSTGSFTDMGQGPIGRGTLYLEDAFVPTENLVGTEGQGFALVMSHFDYSRAAIGLQCLGAARASLAETYAYVRDRRSFGKPIAAFQGVSLPLAEQATLVDAARWACYRTLWLRQAGRPHTAEAAMCKWWAPVVAKDAIEACLLTHGHYGWSDELPFQQRFRDVFGYQIGDGTAQIQKQVIASRLIGPEVKDR
ncbi:MAG TPA: acyl-CoA dehydrogenase family protein [Streptosporangiaceae bacterium]|jgi:cyclohexanecarboxyl-CoA dehydrogenase|nr:acyl-CoA dehydrogenase family protein [Streptosporangiaceae bacterium]